MPFVLYKAIWYFCTKCIYMYQMNVHSLFHIWSTPLCQFPGFKNSFFSFVAWLSNMVYSDSVLYCTLLRFLSIFSMGHNKEIVENGRDITLYPRILRYLWSKKKFYVRKLSIEQTCFPWWPRINILWTSMKCWRNLMQS